MKKRTVLAKLTALGMGILLSFGMAACGQEDAVSERGRIGKKTEAETEAETEDELATGYLTAWDGLVVHSDNPYYPDLIQLIDTLATAPETSCDDTEWYTMWQLKHSSGTTGITVHINKDIRDAAGGIYQSEEDFLNQCIFRISGTIRGDKVDRYISYGAGLKDLQATLDMAHNEELSRQAIEAQSGETDGFEAYYQINFGNGLVFLTSDEQGRIVMLTDSDLTELDSLSGCNRRVRVYDFRPVTEEEAAGLEPKPQIVGKIEFIETF